MWKRGLFLLLLSTFCKGNDLNFDFSSYRRGNETTHVQKLYLNATTDISKIKLENIPPMGGFWLIQIHSYVVNVTLSTSKTFAPLETVSGTNIGLTADRNTTFYLKALNETLCFVAVIVYDAEDPIPGGCNLSFKTENAPYQLVSYTDEVIVVDSQPPKSPGISCEKNNVTVDLYHFYLREYSLESNRYFEGIEKMLTVNEIKANGDKVKTIDGKWRYHKLYASYRGIGHIFAIVATFNGHSSAYVSTISYGCDLKNFEESCFGPVTRHWKVLCAFMLILGAFICFFGHKFFRFTLFLMGCVVGTFCTYAVLFDNIQSLSIGDITTSSIIAGIIGGIIWLIFWTTCGLPIISASFTYFLLSFLVCSIAFYSGPADSEIFHNNTVFWLTFFAIFLFLYLIFLCLTIVSHPLGCSCLGAYAFVVALNYYWGGNLQYIIINIFRRMVVDDFNHATIDPPFQAIDGFQCLLLVILSAWGFYYQMRQNGIRPPFPSNYRSNRTISATEIIRRFYPNHELYSAAAPSSEFDPFHSPDETTPLFNPTRGRSYSRPQSSKWLERLY